MDNSRVLPSLHMVDFSDMKLPMITIYERPADFPEHFVARIWEALPQPAFTNIVMIEKTLDAIHRGIPQRFIRMERNQADDPNIVEVWI